jgi:hypothetical protein
LGSNSWGQIFVFDNILKIVGVNSWGQIFVFDNILICAWI